MKAVTSIVAAAAVSTFAATSAFAGGFAAVINEAPPVVIVPEVVATGSLPGWVIPAAIAVALIAVATQGGSDD